MEAPPLAAVLVFASVLVPVAGGALPPTASGAVDDLRPVLPAIVHLDVEEVGTLPPANPALVNVTVTLCAPAGGLAAGARQVSVEADDGPPWLRVSVEPKTFTFAVVLPGECDEARGLMRLEAGPEAPAFQLERADIVARDANTGSRVTTHEYYFHVGYYGAFDVTPLRGHLTAPLNEPVDHEVRVTNGGNADTTFRLNRAGMREDVLAALPTPLTLAPGESGTMIVTFIVPPDHGLEPRSLELLLTSAARVDHQEPGAGAVVRVDVTPQFGASAILPTPGFAAVIALAAVGAAAVLLGRRRGPSR